MIGEIDGEDDLRREFVGDGFEDGESEFAREAIGIFLILGKVSELFDVDIRQIGTE